MTRRHRLLWVAKRAVLAGLIALVAGAVTSVAGYLHYREGLPSVEELKTWRPPQVTKVTCRDGNVCAEFFTERRTWVDVRTLPAHVRDAFLAAEDADFYQHDGLDYFGMARSALKNLKPGGMKSGASTISQQTCRRLLLSQERTFGRKAREWILTPRMEAALSKDDILNLYVNTIYFGHNRYGVEEASLLYFGKHASALSVGEAAVIAGTVQLPHRINPLTNVVKAKKRQRYVLNQLWQKGFVARDVAERAIEAPIVLGPRPAPSVGQYYAESVRQLLISRYGEKTVMEGGLRVQIAMDPRLQAAAEKAVRTGLEAVDRRQGYRGPLGAIDAHRFSTLRPFLAQRVAEAGRRRPDDVVVADLSALKDLAQVVEEGAEASLDDDEELDEAEASEDEKLARSIGVRILAEGLDTTGVVTSVSDTTGEALVDVIGVQARIAFASVTWARRQAAVPATISDVVHPYELVRVRLGKAIPGTTLLEATLSQVPEVQGALVSIDPVERQVVAVVGGYDFGRSPFNRAIQARRQPGSSFKPFIFGAALATGKYTPISIFNDAPFAVRDGPRTWKPHNFDGRFDGPMTLREALTRSKNTVSVRLLETVGLEPAIAFARQAGITSDVPSNLTLALGTGEVSPLEIANAYTTLASDGQWAEPQLLLKVTDASGRVLEEHRAAREPHIAPPVTALVTSLMRSVVEEGSAVAVLELGRPAAGKTGTAQEYRDAWFSGYTPDLVATAWVGFDDHRPIGPLETGGRAALPVWLSYMKAAHEGLAVRDFELPEGVVQVRVDVQQGKLAGKAIPGRLESFLAGTQPTEETAAPGTVDPNDFMLLPGGPRR